MTIWTNQLSFQYDATPLLRNVSLKIEKGECVAFFGPNGCGKTTLLKIFMGLLNPRKGVVVVEGERMAYVPQISQLDRQFPITVLEAVKMGGIEKEVLRSYRRGCEERAREMLMRVGLGEMTEHLFGSLSGGQMQRALIARALMSSPDVLFLDEATAHVDAEAEKVFHKLIKELKGSMTVVMVTHDLPGVASYIDRFFCVHESVTPYLPTEMCNHFAQGLYHPPLRGGV